MRPLPEQAILRVGCDVAELELGAERLRGALAARERPGEQVTSAMT
ncbi:MAG: hypothetical protein ABIR79_17290 [Candidatus Binatia bacterium]